MAAAHRRVGWQHRSAYAPTCDALLALLQIGQPRTRLFKRGGKCFGIAEILHRELCIAHGFVVFTAAPRNLREQQFVAAALRWVGLRLLLACD